MRRGGAGRYPGGMGSLTIPLLDEPLETALRAQIKSRPSWIATGERRAKEIPGEVQDKKVGDLLPPAAPLDAPFDPLKPVLPKAAAR